MEDLSKSIVESRQELMVSAGNPTLRKSHFLKPSIDPDSEQISDLSPPSLPPTFDPKNWPLTANFYGWMNPSRNWKEWVLKMASLHAPTWKKAGIYEAIFNSTNRFYRNDVLILGVSERWNPNTNSFIFPWGEATITLEDMLIAGYSVLGSPVYEPIETDEAKAIEEALIQERRKLNKTPVKKPLHCAWLKVFKDSGSEIEHEAFLSMWLCRFVLPTSRDVICKCVFPIAIHLARGTRIALAPAVLATIYRDLSLLKEAIVSLNGLGAESDERLVVTTWAPFQLVLVWVWERFVKLSPNPRLIKNGEPRFARWDNLSCKYENVRSVLDSSKESFNWRPYAKIVANWDLPKFYRDSEMWVSRDSDVDEEVLSFIRCSRVSELVGLECIEQYLPHRVGRQLGFDQDIPGSVARCNASREDAWGCYNGSVTGLEFYVPPCLSEADVTTRYLEWWNRSVSIKQQEKNDEITPKASEEKERLKIFSRHHPSPGSSKRKRAVSELMELVELEVSAKSSEKLKNGKASKTPIRKRAAGELNGLDVSAKGSENIKKEEALKSPARKKEAGKLKVLEVSLKSPERKKKGENSKRPTNNGLKVSAKSCKRIKKTEISETLRQIVKRKVNGEAEASVAQVNRSKKSKTLAEVQNKESSNKPATNLNETYNKSVPHGFLAKTDTVKTGDPTADDNTTIAEMIRCNNEGNASGKNLACKVDSNLCPVANNEIAKTPVIAITGLRVELSEAIENKKESPSQSRNNSASPTDNETSKDFDEERSEKSERKQTHSNGNVSDIPHEPQRHLLPNETVIEAAAQLEGFQGQAASEPLKILEQAPLVETAMPEGTEHVANIGDGNPNSSEVLKLDTSMEEVKLCETAEKDRTVDIEEAPRQLDECGSHVSSVADNETPKDPELPEKVILIKTGSPTQNNCSVEDIAQDGNEATDKYDVLEERIDKLVKKMEERKAALFQKHFVVK